MRKLIALIVVVGFGIVFLQHPSFSHEGHTHIRTTENTEKANAVTEQKSAGEAVVNPDEAPSIVFENPNYDFGTIYSGEKAEHLFKFENRGKSDLIIKQVKTSCGCTAAASTKENVPPGGYGEIMATFHAGRDPGKAKKEITVTTNDPVTPKIKLSIAGNIIKDVITNPQWINFGTVTNGDTATKTIEASPGTDFNLEVTGVESDNPSIITSYKKHENGKSYIIDATLKGDAPIGKLKGNITVATNSTKQQKTLIPFSGNITGDVLVSQSVLSYGVVTQGRGSVRKLIVTLRKKDIDIKNVEITPEFLTANLQPKGNSDLPYREVEVKLNGDAPVGKINGNIKIHTNSELQPLIEIPVFGEVREPKPTKS
ncbi:MAG TPA: DUF1573 domain-containing protein [Candidatus Brocadiia bacterium]|nr:DUF1573 domain-containing protein [Planctomycetota bacterium]MBI4008560.1 DUF1573 domain-containing protein [Planctomycetota bacterium]MDO8094213.1 DUF1573 domain-containing protein [Candidatus Brocadiales bacterium]